MPGRWLILASLFIARTAMAVQFQAVAALAPVAIARFEVGLSEIGLLIGLYMLPGLVIALPGGAIGARLGEKRAVAAGMAAMLAGAILMATAPGWGAQVAGRLLAGTGGVVLNVLMTKMVTDWFAGRELATAMAVYVNSWPVGIAGALLLLPNIAEAVGYSGAMMAVAVLVAVGLGFLAPYRAPPGHGTGPAAARPRGVALRAVGLAGVVWALYNGALAIVFSFGPLLLAERGARLGEAGAVTSIVLWLIVVAAPLGGLLADRGRGRDVLVVSLAGSGAAMLLAAAGAPGLASFALIGLLAGLAPGIIMSLPGRVLVPETRSWGMGLYFTIYYVGIVTGPAVGGLVAERLGGAAAAFLLGAALLGGCLAAALAFYALARRIPITA